MGLPPGTERTVPRPTGCPTHPCWLPLGTSGHSCRAHTSRDRAHPTTRTKDHFGGTREKEPFGSCLADPSEEPELLIWKRQESGRFLPGSPEGPHSREELQPSLSSEPVAKAQSRAAEQPSRRGQRNPAKGLAKPIYRRPRQGSRFGRLGQELSPPVILHANLSG